VKRDVPLTLVLAAALAIVLAVSYLVLVRPKRAESARLDAEIAELETKIAVGARPASPGPPAVQINVADLFRLAKAMPDRDDMPGILLELNSTALSTGVEFLSIQPGVPSARGTYFAVPITLTYAGNYYDLADFLFRLRSLVRVRGGELEATGRLFTVNSLNFVESERAFPQIKATLNVNAFIYGTGEATAPPAQAPAQPAAPAQPPAPAPQSPTPPPSGAAAVGAP
jgi:hypothetical protein